MMVKMMGLVMRHTAMKHPNETPLHHTHSRQCNEHPYAIARNIHTSLQEAPPHVISRSTPTRHCEEHSDVAICSTTSSQETTIHHCDKHTTSLQGVKPPTSLRGAKRRQRDDSGWIAEDRIHGRLGRWKGTVTKWRDLTF